MVDFSDIMAVPAQLHGNERVALHDLAKKTQGQFGATRILNIGIWTGGSCHCLRVGAPDAELIGIDVIATRAFSTPGLLDFLHMQVIHRNSNYVDLDGPFHLVFVDGGHEGPVVAEDIRRFVSKVVIGGYAIFHDAGYPFIGQAIREEMPKLGEWELLTPPSTSNLKCFRRLT